MRSRSMKYHGWMLWNWAWDVRYERSQSDEQECNLMGSQFPASLHRTCLFKFCVVSKRGTSRCYVVDDLYRKVLGVLMFYTCFVQHCTLSWFWGFTISAAWELLVSAYEEMTYSVRHCLTHDETVVCLFFHGFVTWCKPESIWEPAENWDPICCLVRCSSYGLMVLLQTNIWTLQGRLKWFELFLDVI